MCKMTCLIFGVVVALATAGFALECLTCKDEGCENPTMEECAFHHPYPFPVKRSVQAPAPAVNFACLYTEYFDDGWRNLSQCVFDAADVCVDLEKKFQVRICALRKPQSLVLDPMRGTTTTSSIVKPLGPPSGGHAHQGSAVLLFLILSYFLCM